MSNLILKTDSYKLTHHAMLPPGTERVYSYLEARQGAKLPQTVFFGLQTILQELQGVVVDMRDVWEASDIAAAHFGNRETFNFDGWMHIVNVHGGRLPLRIKAVPEGTVVPVGNVLMTVENTCDECAWLTNALESLLLHVWYPTTVASVSYSVKQMLARYLTEAGDTLDGLPFMLHDFGYRGASSHESAAVGGAGHLINFMGTDTLPAMEVAHWSYFAPWEGLAYSVPATEHSIMTARGPEGEFEVVRQLLDTYSSGILSVVADSYDIYNFVDQVCTTFKDDILARDGVFVVRPDSVTPTHSQPQDLVVWILDRLWESYGGTETNKGFKVLDSHVRVLWGDGIDPAGIEKIVALAMVHGYSPSNLVFGMGSGLLQKVNRDTMRFATKSSAQRRDGVWHDVWKKPADISKASKRGRLSLVEVDGRLVTVSEPDHTSDLLEVVFEDGKLYNVQKFEQVRARAVLDKSLVSA